MTESPLTALDGGKPYTVRSLENGDIFRAARLVAAITDDGRIYHALGQTQPVFDDEGKVSGTTQNQSALGVAILGATMARAPKELGELLANLVGMNNEQFDKLPITATPDILSELAERDDFDAFLGSVSKLSGMAKKAFGNSQTNTSNATASQTSSS